MIGDETDGTVIPQDLNLQWALSKKKEDYLGKRAHTRSHMADPNRWKLVGLETVDGSVLADGAYAIDRDIQRYDKVLEWADHTDVGANANDQIATQGRVTSTYYSANLERGIAMGLVRNGPDRMGEVIEFNTVEGGTVPTKIVDPVFYDKEGEKQNV